MHACRRYFPCTVPWFLARCELQVVRRGWRRRVQQVLKHAGSLDGAALRAAQAWFASPERKQRWRRQHFMLLRLVDPRHRVGQPDRLNQARLLWNSLLPRSPASTSLPPDMHAACCCSCNISGPRVINSYMLGLPLPAGPHAHLLHACMQCVYAIKTLARLHAGAGLRARQGAC
jgi:hypothetical protein